jgi:hypothetical protein
LSENSATGIHVWEFGPKARGRSPVTVGHILLLLETPRSGEALANIWDQQ